jgi:predicted Zn-dependent protease
MTLSRRAFSGGMCVLCAGGLAACATAGGDPAGRIDGRSDLSPRNMPGLRTAATDSDEDGLRGSMDQMERRVHASRFLVRDAAVNAYVGGVVRTLAGEYAGDIRPYVLRVPDFNATQAPNGMMHVWTGLLLRCTNEAQMAAVLGHEIGHYVRAHSRERLQQGRQISDAIQVFAMIFGAIGVPSATDLTGIFLTAAFFGYNRDHERESDEIGARLMAAAGLSVEEAALNWENVGAEWDALGLPRTQSLLYATHPSDGERAASLRARAAQLPTGERRAAEYRRGLAPIRPALFDDQLRKGQHAATVVIAERWIAEDPRDGLALYAKGEALRLRDAAGDEAAAAETLETALASPETPPGAWRGLGHLRRRRGEGAAADALYREYLRRAPDAPDREFVRRALSS